MPKTADCAARGGSGAGAVLVCTIWCFCVPGAIATAGELSPAGAHCEVPDEQGLAPIGEKIELVAGTNVPDPIQVLRKGNSSSSARKSATSRVPLAYMTPSNRQRAESILDETSLFRELPLLSFECEPAVYRFFTTHPDVAVSIWQVLRISQFQMWQTGPNEYEADAGDGTVGTVDVLYRGQDEQVILCEGALSSPILPQNIRASALMHLRSSFAPGPDGRPRVTSHLCLFVSFPSQTVETAAKIMSPLGNAIIDRNFSEVSLFVCMMSLAMQRQPGWVEQLSDRLENVLEIRKSQLVQLTAETYAGAPRRETGGAAGHRPTVRSASGGTAVVR